MMRLLPIPEVAKLLGERPGTLRRWCREGMPHQPGRKGRGCQTLIDVEIARHWRGAPLDERAMLALAGEIPGILSRSMLERWKQCEGPDKRRLAGLIAAVWYEASASVLNRLREDNGAVPDVRALPPEIEYLRKIARDD